MSNSSQKKLWKYINPNVDSSYRKNNLGYSLYCEVINSNPKKIIDFGVLEGYSTIAMALALKTLGNGGKIIAYDIWTKYEYKHSTLDKTLENLKKYGVDDIVELKEMNFNDWEGEPFDLMHLDISNTGDTIDLLYDKIKDYPGIVLFEGGSKERDDVAWMIEYQKKPISQSKHKYKVVDEEFPSISKLIR